MNFLFEIGLNADDGILGVILHAARSLFYWISSLIYSIIPMLYNLFQDIAGAKLLTNEAFADITGKVGYLLGLIMLLIVIFDFIQLLIDPEKMFDKERGMFAIVKKIIFVLVGLGISTFVFNSLYWFQDYVLDNQILAKIILPSENANIDEELFGGVLAANTFSAFYTVRNDLDMSEGTDAYQCNKYRDLLINNIAYNNDFSAGNICINTVAPFDSNSGVDEDVFVMDYNFILQLIVGGMIVYLFVNYVITVGIRAVQLTVLQIIYPMALIGYLSPKKENIFTKWWKMYFSTYIDVFIRCGIIYFIVYLCALIMDSLTSVDNEFWLSVSENGSSKLMIMVVMILALLTFAKKAPQLISSLLPAGDSKLGFGASWKDISGLTALTAGAAGLGITALGRAPGMVVGGGKAIGALKKNWNESNDLKGKLKAVGKTAGAAALGVGGFALGGIGGAVRGGYAGRSSKGVLDSMKAGQSAVAKANLERAQRGYSGATWKDTLSGWYHNTTGTMSYYQILEGEVSSLNELKSDLEGEDSVKFAQQAHDTAWNEYVKREGQNAKSIDWWEKNEGKKITDALDNAKNDTFRRLMNENGAFATKVKMHNNRFGTKFDNQSFWKDEKDSSGNVTQVGINTIRKSKGTELEKMRAQKPKK